MAFFKKRPSNPAPSGSGQASESGSAHTDGVRRRARHRLIGATILVIAIIATLPWLLDVPPPALSPASVPIVISGQGPGKATPQADLAALAPAASMPTIPAANSVQTGSAPVSATLLPPASQPAPTQTAPDRPERPAASPTASMAAPPTARAEAEKKQPSSATQPSPKVQPAPASLDAFIAQRQNQEQATATASARSDPQQTSAVTHNFPEKGRFVVQIGAYVDPGKLANVRQKLSQAGLNNYTQTVTVNGQQVTRVRIGPFTSRKQMEQVAAKVRALGLPVSMYQL